MKKVGWIRRLGIIGLLLLMQLTAVFGSQSDFDVTTDDANTGSTYRTALNNALKALASNSSGATEPATPYAYQPWADTSTGYMKIRNAANSAWITLWKLSDPSATTADKGLIQIATNSDLIAGTDTAKAATSATIKALLQGLGYAVNEATASIVAATTSDISTAGGNFVTISNSSGTTNITALGTAPAGAARTTHFSIASGSVVLVHNATSMILPAGTNITVADGDVATWRSLGSGNWRATGYLKADGTALSVSGNAPKFFIAYASALQSINESTYTLVNIDTESADASNVFDTANKRVVIPNGETWRLEATVTLANGGTSLYMYTIIYKNGSAWRTTPLQTVGLASPGSGSASSVSGIATGNGTDYYDVYIVQGSGGGGAKDTTAGLIWTRFEGHRI